MYPTRRLSCVRPGRLRGIAPFGVRTFLPPRVTSGKAILRPSKIKVSIAPRPQSDKLTGTAVRLLARPALPARRRGSAVPRGNKPARPLRRRQLAPDSAGTFTPAPVAPSVNDDIKEENQAEAKEDTCPRLVLPNLTQAPHEFGRIHAGMNLHQVGTKKKRRREISPRSLLPIEGPLLHSIQVPDKKDQQERNHRAENRPTAFFEHLPINDRPRIEKDHFDVEKDEEHRH